MALSRRARVANFIHLNPGASSPFIAESLNITSRECNAVLSRLTNEGKLIREECGFKKTYRTPGNYIPVVESNNYEKFPVVHNVSEIRRVEEQVATLEKRGLWRRAQTLLAELSAMQNSASGVGLIALRRNRCVRNMRSGA
ncbi:hypothetical protein OM265_08630 [Escherichia albertii]|nr:hypothetical protein [Escherichia albertii]MCZ8661484.1 hypothetical protein [Escherichia albertii]